MFLVISGMKKNYVTIKCLLYQLKQYKKNEIERCEYNASMKLKGVLCIMQKFNYTMKRE